MGSKKHFILVHGAGHGAWCWYKLVPLLKQGGHQVTALDLGACGINPKRLEDLASISDYVQPLTDFMASLPEDERVILVGHSYGGFSISLAMERFPEKILMAVFVSAYMPNCTNPPSTLLEEYMKWTKMDTLNENDFHFVFTRGPANFPTSSSSLKGMYFEKMLYTGCRREDLELGIMLSRPTVMFMDDLSKESLLTEAKFGSVDRVFIVCEEDLVIKDGLQKWMIANSPAKEVKSIKEAGHMVMFKKPKELCQCLQDIALKY